MRKKVFPFRRQIPFASSRFFHPFFNKHTHVPKGEQKKQLRTFLGERDPYLISMQIENTDTGRLVETTRRHLCNFS